MALAPTPLSLVSPFDESADALLVQCRATPIYKGPIPDTPTIVRACDRTETLPLSLARLALQSGCIAKASVSAKVNEQTVDHLLREVGLLIHNRTMPDYAFVEDGVAALLGGRRRHRTLQWALRYSAAPALGPREPFGAADDYFSELEMAIGLMAIACSPRMSTGLRAWAVSSMRLRPDTLFSLMHYVQLPATVLRKAFSADLLAQGSANLLLYQRSVLRDPEWVASLIPLLPSVCRADLPRLALARLTAPNRRELARLYFERWVSSDADTANEFIGEYSSGPCDYLLTKTALLRILALPKLDPATRAWVIRRLQWTPAHDVGIPTDRPRRELRGNPKTRRDRGL